MSIGLDIGRDEARDLARDELRDPVYERGESLFERIGRWITEWLEKLLNAADGAVSQPLGVAVVISLVVVAAVVIIVKSGPLALRQGRRPGRVFDDERLTAKAHRERSESAAARGDWSLAIVERFRAIVAAVEENGIIDERAGRTADEAANDAGRELPDLAGRLLKAARSFDTVHYGHGQGDEPTYIALRDLDEAVRHARPGHNDAPAIGHENLAAPR